MSQLIAALAVFPARLQQPVHSADRAMKLALIEQRRVDLGRRRVLKTILMEARQHCLLFSFRQSPSREPQPGRRPGKKAGGSAADTTWLAEPPTLGRLVSPPPTG